MFVWPHREPTSRGEVLHNVHSACSSCEVKQVRENQEKWGLASLAYWRNSQSFFFFKRFPRDMAILPGEVRLPFVVFFRWGDDLPRYLFFQLPPKSWKPQKFRVSLAWICCTQKSVTVLQRLAPLVVVRLHKLFLLEERQLEDAEPTAEMCHVVVGSSNCIRPDGQTLERFWEGKKNEIPLGIVGSWEECRMWCSRRDVEGPRKLEAKPRYFLTK